jgi:copper chaperone
MISFKVEDMTCAHCASAISQAIAGVDNAARTHVDIQQKLVQVSSTSSTGALAEAIREAGYTPQLVKEPVEVSQTSTPKRCCCG